MIPQKPTLSNDMSYIRQNATLSSHSLSILQAYKPFVEAIESQVGKLILSDLVAMHKKSLEKIASLTATEEDKIEYKILTSIIQRWSERIERYYKAVESGENKG